MRLLRSYARPPCTSGAALLKVRVWTLVQALPVIGLAGRGTYECLHECLQHSSDEQGVRVQELFTWRFMQTDPNWGNFLYDEATGKVSLIDFGAAQEFPKPFVDDYLRMVKGCADKDDAEIVKRSIRLGFLTGAPSMELQHECSSIVLHSPLRSGLRLKSPSNLTQCC